MVLGFVDSDRRELIEDGYEDLFIKKCGVSRKEGGFVVTASIEVGASTRFSISQARVGEQPTSGGTVSVSSASTLNTYQSVADSPCEFSMIDVDDGMVWMTFRCPHIRGKGIGEDCSIHEGYLALENCWN